MRPRQRRVRPLLLLPVALVAGLGVAHVRLTYTANGNQLYWSSPNNVSIVINSTGSDDVSDGSDETAQRNAILTWNEDSQTAGQLVENKSASQQARTDWWSSGIHLMLFDENNSSGYFPGSSGTVAVTPISFFTTGQIIDADVLFNGKNFDFTTSGTFGDFDIQNVATHELGHLMGLDHSGWASATMYPYVDAATRLQRSLSLDDLRGLRHAYPNATFSRITGTVKRLSDSSVVSGAHVVARDVNGRTAGARLSTASGSFSIEALPAGDYTVYATPLDQPVSALNINLPQSIDVNFESTVLGSLTLGAGSTHAMGDVFVGADVTVSLGRSSNEFPIHVEAGATTGPLTLYGLGLTAGSSLTSSDLSGSPVLITPTSWNGSTVQFSVTVPGGTAPGHLDLITSNGSGTSILPAALEITPPAPAVGTVTPSTGDSGGGVGLLIQGVGFNPGSRVVIADHIYEDGQPGGCTVVDPNTITLTTAASSVAFAGLHDVVVLDRSGVEGRNADAFQITVVPTIGVLFPTAGDSAGSSVVTVTGQDFAPDATVTIDGVGQTILNQTSTAISISTSAGVPGAHTLAVHSHGAQAAVLFTYVASPDPELTTVIPPVGSESGGQTLTLYGNDFTANTEVLFGASAETGLGGGMASSVQFIDSTTLRVVTPALPPGAKNVIVRQSDTQQSSVLAAGFTFQQDVQPSGGGCGVVLPSGRPPLADALSGGAWFGLLLLLLGLRARGSRSASVA